MRFYSPALVPSIKRIEKDPSRYFIQCHHPVGINKVSPCSRKHSIPSIPSNAGNFSKSGIFYIIIFQCISCIRNLIQTIFPFVFKKHHMFSSVKMRMENMRHINIIMQESYRSFTTEEHARYFIQKNLPIRSLGRDIIVQ